MTYSPNFRGPPIEGGSGSGTQLKSGYTNNSGGTLVKATPVAIDSSGELIAIDVANETKVYRFVGLTEGDILNATSGDVTEVGRLEDVTTSLVVGDPVYVSKSGGLTSTKPDIGVASFVAGDFIIFVGVVVKNEGNPTLKDIKLMPTIVGKL